MKITAQNPEKIKILMREAKNVLDRNWTGSFTRPAEGQYPYQWSWDSVFIAMGYSHYNQERAEQEYRHLLSGQWKNGMIPQINFSDKKSESYFPGPDFWQVEKSEHAPKHPKTSGICQPPIHAVGLLHLLKHAPDRERALNFCKEIFPKLEAWHQYLYRERDPFDEGLAYIRHPWESGQDNSPIWNEVLNALILEPDQIPYYVRKDIRLIDPSERPTDDDYDKFVYLLLFSRERNYNEERILKDDCPFLMQDVLFNTLLCKANQDLAEIAGIIGKDPTPFLNWAKKTTTSINNKLWYDQEAMYADYDLRADKKVQARVLSGFIPLYAGIPDEIKKNKIFNYLNTHCFCQMTDECFPAPTFDRSRDGYSSRLYWRGPVWINMNWLLKKGLEQYGFEDYVAQLNHSIMELTQKSGFREYYDTDDGKGYGADNFSWTASLLIDVLYDKKA